MVLAIYRGLFRFYYMEVLHIYKQSDLDAVIENGVVDYDIYVHSVDLSLDHIKKISGYLGFANVDQIHLREIEEIGGDLWVGTSLQEISLDNLVKVGGSINLSYSPIKTLGKLNYIGGDLALRNTEITDFGALSYIGGNLFLPTPLKGKINLDNITIQGEVKYCKPTTPPLTKKQRGLVPSSIPIPVINPRISEGVVDRYVYSLSQASKEQQEFFQYFKQSFYNGTVIDVRGFLEYPRFLLQSMMEDLSKPLNFWLDDYDRLIYSYPELADDGAYYFRWHSKRYDIGWELTKRNTHVDISSIGYYEEKLDKRLFSTEFLLKWNGAVVLSPFGKQHIPEITPFIQQQLESFEKKWNRRFLQVFVDESLNPKQEYSFYKQFFLSEEQFNLYNQNVYGKFLPTNYKQPLPSLVEGAAKVQCKRFTIDAEDAYRASIGMPKIGEYWKSETELYYSLKEAFHSTDVRQHFSPKWLGLQHLDIYFPQYNIGVEYQGIQHYKPVDYFGGEEAFIKGQERDARKKRLCEENNCTLIYVNEGYSLPELIETIKQKMTQRS